MNPVVTKRLKRLLVFVFFLVAIVLMAALCLAYLLTRDPGISTATASTVEANTFKRRLKLFTNSVAAGKQGYVRLSQSEINSYLKSTLTNHLGDTNLPGLHLTKAFVDLTTTNFILYSWGHLKVMNYTVPLVVQRSYRVEQEGTNQWQMPLETLRIGEVDIPPRLWERVLPEVEKMDGPLHTTFAWATNVQAMLITKNELSLRPEVRLYTYKPIPPGDLP